MQGIHMTDELAEEIRNRTSSSGVIPVPLPWQLYISNVQIMRSMMALHPLFAPFVRTQ